MQYSQDFDETLPSGVAVTGWASFFKGVGWAGEVFPFLANAGTFRCPDDPQSGAGESVPVSYAFNAGLAGLPLSEALSPARTICLSEITGQAVNVADPREIGSASHSATDFGDNLATTDLGEPAVASCCGGQPQKYQTGAYVPNPPDLPFFSGHHLDGQEGPARHRGAALFLLADGHVRRIPGSQITILSVKQGRCVSAFCYSPD